MKPYLAFCLVAVEFQPPLSRHFVSFIESLKTETLSAPCAASGRSAIDIRFNRPKIE
jgi:hypothetical protein